MVTQGHYDITPDDVDIAVRAERDRLLARIEALVLTCEEGCAGPGLCDGSCYRTIFQYEERAR